MTNTLLFAVLAAAVVFSIIFTISIGSTEIPVSDVYGIIKDHIFGGDAELNAGLWAKPQFQIIWNIRMPRVLFGALCGAGLAICGAAMQALVLNPIADPYVLGVSSGASAGAAWALLMPLPFFEGQYQTTMAAFVGALFSAFVVYFMAKRAGGGKLQPVTLLLSGTAVNAVMSAITSYLIFRAKSPESIAAVYNWQMGSLAAAQWKTLLLPAVGVTLGVIFFTVMGSRFNMIMMGDDDAAAMGLHVRLFRTVMFGFCSIVVASLVSVTGIIGFVGLVVPHVVRLIARTSNNRVIMPLSALLGSIYLMWADALARSAFGAAELPLGIITAFVGAPFFMFLMIKNGYGGHRK
ncbi:MAG: iron ABC transporter permease [Ruminiclostridium sp.]|uniref:FecCD family ABC transporter permease n=1 Tax=Ruminococcus sp. TaxID=41978 RepID=UPI0025E6BD0D|nr:iron ABC transporter permease [Ruminococcus sp.]MBR1432554.1 iron ABC transporter permease [Ruminococcus sp.]MBR1832640.1 iron ABC transporter permease [Ruminiclostridium sp.]